MHGHGHRGGGRDHFFKAFGPPGPGRGGWGGGPPWGDPRMGRGRRRMRRGDVRAALLVLLDEQPHTGYSAMEELEQRSNGAWRPSPGSVYPTLQQLEDEGLIEQQAGEGRTPYTLTEKGKTYVAEHREELGEPWAKSSEGIGEERLELKPLIAQIAAASFQVGTAGDDAQVEKAKELLAETRRGLYKILADDDTEEA
jgi:DNA-binding PadR family transcriptional regulator